MRLVYGVDAISVATDEVVTFGRSAEADVTVAAGDNSVSRQAGRIEFDLFQWTVTNVGRRPFSIVQGGTDTEVAPGETGRNRAALLYPDAWIRIPTQSGDEAIELETPENERPPAHLLDASQSATVGTLLEREVSLTENELRSVVAVYWNYLVLPPMYRREPNSYRAAARRLGVEEGKVKADLRRVQQKVANARGAEVAGTRTRDALIEWLLSRQIVSRSDTGVLE